MVYPAYHSFSQAFDSGNTEINMNIVKSSTRLSHMFFTFSNSRINDDNKAGEYDKKRWNYFHHPMVATIDNLEGVIDSDKQISAQIQIANKKFPAQEITNIAEFMYFLRRAVNVMSPCRPILTALVLTFTAMLTIIFLEELTLISNLL